MSQQIYFTIFDTKAETFHMPFHAKTQKEAKRIVSQVVNSQEPGNLLNTNPEDYILYQCGSFDQNTGEMLGLLNKQRMSLLNCADLKNVIGESEHL